MNLKVESALLLNSGKKNNIKQHSLYHRRKRAGLLEKKEIPQRENIGISIGEINLSIPSTEKELVVEIIKELSKIC